MRHGTENPVARSSVSARIAPDIAVRTAKARLAAETIALAVQAADARKAQAVGVGQGARLPAGPARRRVELLEITKVRADGSRERRTSPGGRTARVVLPRILASLDDTDPRRLAALRYATLVERIGSMPVADWDGPRDGPRAGDGGATRRVAIVTELRQCQACAPEVAIITPRTKGSRRAVTVRAAVDGVCLLGLEVKGVLRAHGWSAWGGPVRQVTDAVLAALSAMAEMQGSRSNPDKSEKENLHLG